MANTSFFSAIRSLGVWRSSDAPIAGVASGLARKWNVDPLLVRAGFLALTFAGGAGAMLYALCWAFLPDEFTGEIHAQELLHGRISGGLVGAAALLTIAIVVFTGLSFTSTLGLIVTVAIAAVVYHSFRRDHPLDTPGPSVSTNDDESPQPHPAESAQTQSAHYPQGQSASTGDAFASERPTETYTRPGETYTRPRDTDTSQAATSDAWRQQKRQQRDHERAAARSQREEMRARRRLSGRTVAAALAIALLAIAGFLLLLEVTGASVHQLPATIAFASLVLGAIVLAIGIFGRRGGVLSFFALIAAMLTIPVMLINTTVYSNQATMSEKSWKPTSVSEIGTGYSVTMGSSSIDFSRFDSGNSTEPIKVSASMGDLDLRFGADQKVAINADLKMSSIQTEVPYIDGEDSYSDNQPGGSEPFSIFYETDPEWGDDLDADEWDEQWEDHSNTYAFRDSFEGSDSRTVYLGGITDVNDADIVIDLQGSMSGITIRQQVTDYPGDDASPSATPEPSATSTTGK